MVLLVLTIVRTAATGTMVWKSSSLPVLQVLSEGMKRNLGEVDQIEIAKKRVEKLRVRLEGEEGLGWRLVGGNRGSYE